QVGIRSSKVGHTIQGKLRQSRLLLAVFTDNFNVVRGGHSRELIAGYMQIQSNRSTSLAIDCRQINLTAIQLSAGLGHSGGGATGRRTITVKSNGRTNCLGIEQVPASQPSIVINLVRHRELDDVDTLISGDLTVIVGAVGA